MCVKVVILVKLKRFFSKIFENLTVRINLKIEAKRNLKLNGQKKFEK